MLAAGPPPANLRERRLPRDEMTEPAAALRRLRRLHEATRSRPPPVAAGPAPAAAEAPIALRPEPHRPLGVGDLMLGCTFQKPDAEGVLRVVGRTQAVGTVAAALALGVRFIDTAPLYGAGLSEEYIGDALAEAGLGATQGLRVWSKAGVVVRRSDQLFTWQPPLPLGYLGERATIRDYSHAMARRCLTESLVRLRIPHLVGLRIHGPNRTGAHDRLRLFSPV